MALRDRLPRVPEGVPIVATLAKWAEALLLLLLTIQLARLLWVLIVPMGMVGEWQPRRPAPLPAEARMALFRAFDPFTRGQTAEASGGQVTGLSLQLFGTRINEGSGQGSAIIATPDGLQSSFAVGDQIMPGVTLKEVAYDHVVIDRGGAAETLFLDQSTGSDQGGGEGEGGGRHEGGSSAPAAGTAPPAAQSGPPPAPTPSSIQRDIGFMPRMDAGRVSGIVLSPRGEGQGFETAGFKPGDIITQINGRPITSTGDIQSLQAQLRPGARISLMVERGAATVPIAITLSGAQ